MKEWHFRFFITVMLALVTPLNPFILPLTIFGAIETYNAHKNPEVGNAPG